MTATPVSSLITQAYHPLWRSMRDFEHDEYWMEGGRGSGKSTVAALRMVKSLVADPTANWAAYKKHRTEIETTTYAEISKAIMRLGWGDLFKFKTSPFEIQYRPTGQRFFFRGLDDPGKSKGFACTTGYLQGVWFEEYDQFDSQKEIDTVLQSLGRGGPKFQVIVTFNPPESTAHWANVEAAKPCPHRMRLHTTYKDWRADWLGGFFFRKMEAIRTADEMRYRHEYLGEVTGTGREIFRNIRPVRFSDEDIAEMRSKRWGMDFGQGDPTVLLGVNYIPRRVDGKDIGGKVQIFDEWYRSDARNAEIFEAIAKRGLLDAAITGDPGGGGKSVINEMRYMGVRGLRQAYKPGGSVERGIRFFRDCTDVEIDPVRCPNAYREWRGYLYDAMRDGTNRNTPPDRDNHTIDSGRYALEDFIFSGGTSRLLL